MSRNPSTKFYTKEWRVDGRIRTLSLAARGLWVELFALIRPDGEPGVPCLGHGEPLQVCHLWRMAVSTRREINQLLKELVAAKAIELRGDTIFLPLALEWAEKVARSPLSSWAR